MTSIHRLLYDPEQDSTPLPEKFDFVEKPESDRKAQRAFWRGALIFGVIGFALGYYVGVSIYEWTGM